MRYTLYNIYMLGLLLLVGATTSCQEDSTWFDDLAPDQQELIGKAVNFDVAMAESFTTRTSYQSDGRFNDADQMTIFRQYWGTNDWEGTAYRVYSYDVKYATNTDISLGRNWKVKVGKMGADWDDNNNKLAEPFEQKDKDSLTWENGKTVRFRAWSRSNYAGCISGTDGRNYYPDFCIADWVTVSGPTQGIPLVLRHVTTRIGFAYHEGNQLEGAEICLEPGDYLWEDNANTAANDAADKFTPERASEIAQQVSSVYDRMCMPAGVNIDDGTLRAMTTTLYDNMVKTEDQHSFTKIEEYGADDGVVEYHALSGEQIKTNVKRPTFSLVNSYLYMFSIPYDMSTDATSGNILVLPKETRFKVRLRDVNKGDAANSTSYDSYEAKEHIFSLTDIKDSEGNEKFPDGLVLTPGASYMFTVGYQYDRLKVDVIEEGMKWSEGGSTSGEATKDVITPTSVSMYGWWKDAIYNAIYRTTTGSYDYNPVFEIETLEEFEEFIALVNGTAINTELPELKRAYRPDKDPNPEADPLDDVKESHKWWYQDGVIDGDTTWISRSRAAELGYILYREYHPLISDKAAYSEEKCLKGAFSFFDERVSLHFVVQLKNNLDLGDISLPAIGKDSDHPFKGLFDGGVHTLSNVNMQGGYLFGYLEDGEIRDLHITSTHPTGLLNIGRTSKKSMNIRIVGISVKADSPAGKSPIANQLLGIDADSDGNAYVIGCIHEGNAGNALVGKANNMTMLGCMYTASNRGGAALLGAYTDYKTKNFLAPQGATLTWGNFMCNYYLKEPKGVTNGNKALDNVADNYNVLQYIRGTNSHVLKAKVDNLLADDVKYKDLSSDKMKEEYYGIAPWRAMNYAIAKYNESVRNLHEYGSEPYENHMCMQQYNVTDVGYQHLYPQLIPVTNAIMPTDEGLKNPLKQNN